MQGLRTGERIRPEVHYCRWEVVPWMALPVAAAARGPGTAPHASGRGLSTSCSALSPHARGPVFIGRFKPQLHWAKIGVTPHHVSLGFLFKSLFLPEKLAFKGNSGLFLTHVAQFSIPQTVHAQGQGRVSWFYSGCSLLGIFRLAPQREFQHGLFPIWAKIFPSSPTRGMPHKIHYHVAFNRQK